MSIVIVGALPACAQDDTVMSSVGDWPAMPKNTIKIMLAKYGEPDEIMKNEVIWDNRNMSNMRLNPFKYIRVYREIITHSFPFPHPDFIEHVINYRVPPARMGELASYNGSISFQRTKGEMAVSSYSEEMNIVTLNIANDIITFKRKTEDARKYHAKLARDLLKGKKPDYGRRLLFDVDNNTADPDRQLRD
jgi:hypothetical protein